jgi:hypothetical protein
LWYFLTSLFFYGEELLASRPISKMEGHPLSAVRDCLFNIFRSYPPYLEGFYLREIGWDDMDCVELAQDRGKWRALVNTVMNLRIS